MEIGTVVSELCVLLINGWIQEADLGLALARQFLIHQRNAASPHRGRKTSTAIFLRSAGGLIGANVEREVGVGRDVRAIAIGSRTLVAGIDHAWVLLLPVWNGNPVRRDPAPASRNAITAARSLAACL